MGSAVTSRLVETLPLFVPALEYSPQLALFRAYPICQQATPASASPNSSLHTPPEKGYQARGWREGEGGGNVRGARGGGGASCQQATFVSASPNWSLHTPPEKGGIKEGGGGTPQGVQQCICAPFLPLRPQPRAPILPPLYLIPSLPTPTPTPTPQPSPHVRRALLYTSRRPDGANRSSPSSAANIQ